MGKCVGDAHDPFEFLPEFRGACFDAEKVYGNYVDNVFAALEPSFWIFIFWLVVSAS